MHNDLDLRIWDEDLNSQYLRVDHPHLYSAVGPFEEVIAEAEVLVVSKRFLDRTLQNRKPHQLILNFSDSQGIKADNLENLYR